MSSYIVKTGDTFERISKRVYGVESSADIIKQANPGASLTPGTTLFIPEVLTSQERPVPADDQDELSIKVNGNVFRYWTSASVTRNLDSFDTMKFEAPFEVGNVEFREQFQPFSYHRAIVSIGGEPLFTGRGLNVAPHYSPSTPTRVVMFDGYSLPAVLNDCNFPNSAFPMEFNEQTLSQIARASVRSLGLQVEMNGSPGPVFERVACDPDKKGYDFLSELAKQRNFVISSTPRGLLLFQKSVRVGSPVARLVEDMPPVTSVTSEFKPQQFYSHVTGIQPSFIGTEGGQYTVKNPFLSGVLRPYTYKVDDAVPGDLKTAVESKAGRMFANCVSYTVGLNSWRDPSGALWRPNTTLMLLAPSAMIYQYYEFIIRSVTFMQSETERNVSLNLILPGSFSGEMPESLPWQQ